MACALLFAINSGYNILLFSTKFFRETNIQHLFDPSKNHFSMKMLLFRFLISVPIDDLNIS